ncbi:MAG: hypothetical protein HZC17_02645, partial [Candidatus Omnitrophica bacterium]|nr:hypothetical protein [Candidatus Omnitrophota bacterium]
MQKNIAKILEHLSACEPRLAVGVEGAVSPLRPDLFEFTSNQKTNFKIADTLAQWGELSGAELFSLKTGGKIPVFGIEDESTYRENVRTFRAVMAGKRKIDAELEELKNSLEIDKSKIFKKDIRNFDKEVLNFKSKKTDPDLFCSQIAVRAKKHLNLDLSDLLNQAKWPNLVRLMILKKMEMVSRENAVRSILRSELEGPALFREINALTDRIYFRLAQTPEEKELVERTKRLELRRKIVHLEATRDEVVNSRAESFDRAFFLFYDQAVIREHSMVERLLEHKAPILVLIAGGFHTAGLKKMLKNRGVPFLVVRPRMTKVA